jgi:hypothetical protein
MKRIRALSGICKCALIGRYKIAKQDALLTPMLFLSVFVINMGGDIKSNHYVPAIRQAMLTEFEKGQALIDLF